MVLSSFRRVLSKALPGAAVALPAPENELAPAATSLFPVPQGPVPIGERRTPNEERRGGGAPPDEALPADGRLAVAVAKRNELVAPEPARSPPTIIVRPLGAMANRMIQHMTAMKIASMVPGSRISRIHLPEWGIDEQEIPEVPDPTINLNRMYADVEGAAAALRDGSARSIEITGYVQHMNNLLGPEAYRATFSSDMPVEAYGPDVLLINIRSAEILTGQFPPYVLIPIAFYRQIVRETGLTPVFFGQLSECPYMDELRATFPEAIFRHGAGVVHDWEVLRRSKNICMSVSTFSWAACWLSEADRIFMPLTGLLNPVQGITSTDGTNLVPVDDNRYLFYNFMLNEAVPQDRYREIHGILEGHWTLVTGAWVTNMLERRKTLKCNLDDYLAVFDEEYYLRVHGELAVAKEQGWISSGRNHFEIHGFDEGRTPCRIDIGYAYRHPDAAMAVSNGEYLDLLHFHAARGRLLGYEADQA